MVTIYWWTTHRLKVAPALRSRPVAFVKCESSQLWSVKNANLGQTTFSKPLESATQTLTPALGSGLYTGSPNIHRPRSSLATKKSAGKLPSKGPHSPGLAQQCWPRQEHSQHAFFVCSSLYSRTAILALPLAQEACTTHDSSLICSRNCLSYRHRTKTQCAAALAYRPRYQHMTQHRSSIHTRERHSKGTPHLMEGSSILPYCAMHLSPTLGTHPARLLRVPPPNKLN